MEGRKENLKIFLPPTIYPFLELFYFGFTASFSIFQHSITQGKAKLDFALVSEISKNPQKVVN